MALTNDEAKTGKSALSKKFLFVSPPSADVSGFGVSAGPSIMVMEKTTITPQRLQEFKDEVAKAVGHAVEDTDFRILHTGGIVAARAK